MKRNKTKPLRLLFALLLVSIALAGCGKNTTIRNESQTPEQTKLTTPESLDSANNMNSEERSKNAGGINHSDIADGTEHTKENDPLHLKSLQVPLIGADEFPKIDGSTATLPLSKALYRLCTNATEEEAELAITHNKTDSAYRMLLESTKDATEDWDPDLVIAYEPSAETKQELNDAGNPLLMKPIGKDALVFLANASNPVNSLSKSQLQEIYAGKLTSWKALGGEQADILAFQRQENSGSQTLMQSLVMDGRKMAQPPENMIATEMGELIKTVAAYNNTGNALGYSVYYFAKNMYEMPGLKLLAIDGISPSPVSIRNGSYPFVNDFYAVIRKDEPSDSPARKLYDWLTTGDGQSLVNALGYVGISNADKPLPETFSTSEEESEASLALPDGTVLLADGSWYFHTALSGTAVLDKNRKLLRFLNDITLENGNSFIECSIETPVPMMDMKNDGKIGMYSLKENRWVIDPGSGTVTEVPEGFLLWFWSDDGEENRYLLCETSGTIHELSEENGKSMYEENVTSMWKRTIPENFAAAYPDILAKWNVTPTEISFDYASAEGLPLVYIETDSALHYYDLFGNSLFSYSKEHESKNGQNIYRSAGKVGNGSYFLRSYNSEEITCVLYRNGEAVWQESAQINEKERMERLSDLQPAEDFYFIQTGNYIRFYNYDGSYCGKQLSGWSAED